MTTDVRACPCTPFPQILAAETVPPAFWGKGEKKAWCTTLGVPHSRFDSKWQELGYITGVIPLDGKSNTIDAVAMRATTDSELIERCTLQVGPRVCSIVDVLGKRQLPAEKRITVDDLQNVIGPALKRARVGVFTALAGRARVDSECGAAVSIVDGFCKGGDTAKPSFLRILQVTKGFLEKLRAKETESTARKRLLGDCRKMLILDALLQACNLATLVCINRQSDSCVVFQTDISSADLEEARQCLQILQFSRVTMLRYFTLQHGDSGPALKKAMEQVVTGYTGEKPIARKAKTMAKQTSFVRHKGAVKCDPTSRVVFRMETNHLVGLTIKINGELGVPAVTFAIPCFKS